MPMIMHNSRQIQTSQLPFLGSTFPVSVYPNEVEEMVSLHPGVPEVGAVGVPDPASGEAVKIVVVKRDPLLTVEDLKAHCRKYLTTYKIPRAVEFRRELPKTNLGGVPPACATRPSSRLRRPR